MPDPKAKPPASWLSRIVIPLEDIVAAVIHIIVISALTYIVLTWRQ